MQIEGLVLLKIIKHCQDGLPQVVTGSLVGLPEEPDQDTQKVNRVEISNCFPKLTSHSLSDKDKNRKAGDESRHVSFLRQMQKVNMDTEPTGWYRSSFYGYFINQQQVRELYLFQKRCTGAVLLVYDPYSTCTGRLALRAYRLTDAFMNFLDLNKLTAGEFQKHNIDMHTVVEELPIHVHNSHMVHAYLYELRERKTTGWGHDDKLRCDFDRLYMEQSSRIVNDLRALGTSIEHYLYEGAMWQKWQRDAYHQRRRRDKEINERQAENQTRRMKNLPELPVDDIKRKYPPVEDPDRLGATLVTAQINQYCNSVSDNISQALSKLCVAQGLNGDVR